MIYTTKVRRKMYTYHLNNQLMLNTLIFHSVSNIGHVLTISLQEVEKRYSKPSKRKEESHDPPDSDSDLNLERARKSKKTKMLGDACLEHFFGSNGLGMVNHGPINRDLYIPRNFHSEMAMFLVIGSPFGRS